LQRILVVDDEPDIAISLKIGLEMNGFKVDAYSDPEEALTNYRPRRYSLLIFDVRMPQMTGIELARRVRELDFSADIWFVTAFDILDEYEEELRAIRPINFLRKPFSINDLASKISDHYKNATGNLGLKVLI
jgi:DNA-binding response OmpR family regulator